MINPCMVHNNKRMAKGSYSLCNNNAWPLSQVLWLLPAHPTTLTCPPIKLRWEVSVASICALVRYGLLNATHSGLLAYYRCQLQLPYKSCRTCLPNHMGSISCYIMPLVINSLKGGDTHARARAHTHTHTHTRTNANTNIHTDFPGKAILRNHACTNHRLVCV